jgi:hypothetical protein
MRGVASGEAGLHRARTAGSGTLVFLHSRSRGCSARRQGDKLFLSEGVNFGVSAFGESNVQPVQNLKSPNPQSFNVVM